MQIQLFKWPSFFLSFLIILNTGCDKGGSPNPPPPPPSPTIAGFSPSAAAAGEQLIITGTNFSANASTNNVKFNGTTATVSAATNSQVISFVISTTICLALILLGFEPVIDALQGVFPQMVVDQLTNLSFPYHFEAIQRGVIDLRDIIYFFSLMLMSLFVGAVILDRSKA